MAPASTMLEWKCKHGECLADFQSRLRIKLKSSLRWLN
jgi:hypothetical protein